jgi:hypothetical protein
MEKILEFEFLTRIKGKVLARLSLWGFILKVKTGNSR